MSSGTGMRTRSRRTRTPQVLEPEPHMSLQRPSSAWSQDIAHILDRCFGATFSEQSIEVETIRNFTPGSDAGTYQSRYADRLKTALHQFDTQNNLLDSANKRNADLHDAFISLFASEQFESPASTLNIPPRTAPDKSLLDLSLFDKTSLISPDSYYPFVFTRYLPPTRDPGVRPSYENATQNWEEKGTALPLIKDTNIIRHQPHSNTSRTLKSQVKNRPKTRHDTHTRNLTPQSAKPTENFISSVNSDNYFISEPSELIFDSYEPHKTYTGQILLRNVSRYMREFRIFTPKTEFFALSEQTTDFDIAPGMTSQISVVFTPDSFGNYSDQIKVVSEDRKSFFIPLTGARPCPILSLPYSLDCGHSIANIERNISYICTNSGGAGYFAFSQENTWFDPSLAKENSENCLVLNKFVISPVLFELKSGEFLEINIHFSPDSENEFIEEIFLHCSNKTTISFELYGVAHHPKVEIFSLTQTQNNLDLDPATMSENGIQITSQIFKCQPVTLGHKSDLEITVKNIRPIPLNVKWAIVENENDKENSPILENSIFKITPENAIIGPSENHDFCVTFTPKAVDMYYGCLELLLLSELSPVIATLYLEAECRDVCIVPLPPLIVSPGSHLIGSVISHSIQLWNHGCSPVTIEWVTQPYENDIEISPSKCDLAPDQYLYFSVHISRSIPGLFEHNLICKIEESNTLLFPLKCEFRAANISIDQMDLNLGLISYDVTINHTFSITNKDNTKACVDINTRDLTLYSNTLIKVNPTQIEIGPFSSSQIELEISTMDTGDIDCIVECIECYGGSIALLHITGLVQRPVVVVENSPLISLGDIFVNVPNVTMVTLRNLSKLPAEFEWNSSIQNSEFCDEFRVNFSAKNGIIDGMGSCEVEIEITCMKILGIVEDILILCNVENADEPVILSVSCEVKGMSVTFSHNQQPLSPHGLSLDFGTVPINTKNTLDFVVTNNTDISAPIKIWVDKFPADESAGEIARGFKRPGKEFDVYLGEDTLKKRLEFDEQSVWKAYLSTGQGVCFLVQSESNTISPHSSTTISLTAFSSMWGKYSDTLYCKIDGIEQTFCFEFRINVVGCPIKFHSMPPGQQPIIRFGSHLFEKAIVTRKIRLNNTSPCDIRIDWRVYTQISDQSDHDVIDIEMTYGNPLPSQVHTLSYSDQNELESDLIQLFLHPHDSVQSIDTFTIGPAQCVIPGDGNITLEFIFFPTADNLAKFGQNIHGHALGYLSLDYLPVHQGNIIRPQGKLVEPLRVDFNAGIIHPKIEIMPVNSQLEEEVLGFAFPASKLMKINLGQFQTYKSSYQTYQQITIQNPTKQKLNFDIILPSQLKIADFSQIPLDPLTNLYILKPNQLVTLKINFTLEAKQMTSSFVNKQTDWSIQTKKDGHKYLAYKQNIQIEFPSKLTQYLPVEARIELPLLKLSTDTINFGPTEIGEVFSQQICVYNYASKCYSKWKAVIRPDNSILTLDSYNGLLQGLYGGHDYSAKTLLISFSPLEEMDYEFEVVFTGEFLEIPLYMKVLGSGRYR